MKVLTYEYENMKEVGQLLELLKIRGVEQARILARIGDILDSGTVGEVIEKKEEKRKKDGMDSKEVCTDKLAK